MPKVINLNRLAVFSNKRSKLSLDLWLALTHHTHLAARGLKQCSQLRFAVDLTDSQSTSLVTTVDRHCIGLISLK